MKKLLPGLMAGVAALALSATALPSAQAQQTADAPVANAKKDAGKGVTKGAHRLDNRPGPLTARQDMLREKALASLANGSASLDPSSEGGAVVTLEGGPRGEAQKGPAAKAARDKHTQHYEFPLDKTDQVFSILADFGGSGPLNNEIPEPNRNVDNSTYWVPDFNKAHYEELFNGDGESFKNYYLAQSGGRYTAVNQVQDWVTVPGDAASYGANPHEDNGGAWDFITDSANAWYADQKAQGKTDAEINTYLQSLDQWDRYDHDGDGDFNESDGYIDHFQAIHAGEGEEAGGGAQGEDAIWSHRWYVNQDDYGRTGPANAMFGGTRIGTTDFWIGDYTVEPENGGLGVFAHEFGHDLGLPDFYDTNSGDNGTAFWTLMSSGSWLGHGDEGIGTTPGGLGPQEKLDLGWLDYTEVNQGQTYTANLGPSQNTYDNPGTVENESDQAIKVNLPDKVTETDYTTPPEGDNAWWSGRGDKLNNTMSRPVAAGDSVSVSASAWYEIEAGFDYLYGEYSVDGGATWVDAGEPVTGSSEDAWTDLAFSYDPGGVPSIFRFRYQTDGGVNEAGAFLDQITVAVDGTTVATDGAEVGNNGWTVDGWTRSTGTDVQTTDYYYLLENRQYVGWDDTLRTGPYSFPEAVTRPDWVQFFQFRPGMLVWVTDKSYPNNNTSLTPGHGETLVVDARPKPMKWSDGTMPTNRRQPWDAAFGLSKVRETCLEKQVPADNRDGYRTLEACAPAGPGIPTFDDSDPDRYWSAANPQNSTLVSGLGVRATVVKEKKGHLTVKVSNPRAQ
ncbi:immune inhibitor A domain-containing protein [Nocardioides sp. LHG3406-4]|uniref:immune inhibitor A domain-containing protein n=1 Tax=Nocardioides sp. LHG3406-4 TaxID=2804575 RepID=UPI003CECFB62